MSCCLLLRPRSTNHQRKRNVFVLPCTFIACFLCWHHLCWFWPQSFHLKHMSIVTKNISTIWAIFVKDTRMHFRQHPLFLTCQTTPQTLPTRKNRKHFMVRNDEKSEATCQFNLRRNTAIPCNGVSRPMFPRTLLQDFTKIRVVPSSCFCCLAKR